MENHDGSTDNIKKIKTRRLAIPMGSGIAVGIILGVIMGKIAIGLIIGIVIGGIGILINRGRLK